MATSREPHWPGGAFPLNAHTVRRARYVKGNIRVTHLFVDYTNGGVSGFPMSFCGIISRTEDHWGYQRAIDKLPLCNQCGRAFHKERKQWRGRP